MKTLASRKVSLSYSVRAAIAAGLLLLLGLAVATLGSPPPESDGRVTHTVSGNTETWRVDEPNVKKKILEFQQIRFQAGDKVRIIAGGCVQTGGSGKTWKRYVDPLGPNSDKLYHGMVLIPGAIGNLPANDLDRFARILIVKGTTFTVKPITEPRKQHLWLGYEDDHYGDNGYTGQDEGTQGQCRIGNGWVEHAFVVVNITHGEAPPVGNLASFDIAAHTDPAHNPPVDDNGILLNPMWGRQITNNQLPDHNQCGGGDPYSSPCTTQPTEEDHGFLCSYGTLGIVDGHHNWVAGTYEGTVFWNDQSSYFADGDYNFRLVRPDEAGMTVENKPKVPTNKKSMKLEFSSGETIYNFETPWWDAFHKAVDKDDFSSANAMVVGPDGNAGTFGIVSGLIGLDCPHTCASELHPVWAMAIKVKHDAADETWAIFVRRFGDEGFCSDHQHYLDDLLNDTYTFRLPWRPGATAVAVNPETTFESQLGQATGSLGVAQGQGVLLSFTMAVPQIPLQPREMVDGELHLKWTIPPGGALHPPLDGMAVATEAGGRGVRPRPPLQVREEEPEDRLGRLVTSMTPAERQTFEARVPRAPLAHGKVALHLGAPRVLASLPNRVVRARGPKARSVADPQKAAMDRQRLDALHAIYGAAIPGFPVTRIPRTPRPRVP